MTDIQNKGRAGWIWFIPIVLFVALSILFYNRLGHDPNHLPSAMLGKALPEFELPDLITGDSLSVDWLKEKAGDQYFLLNVWASWCPSCYDEHSYLMQLDKDGVMIVGVNYKDKTVDAHGFIEKMGNPFTGIIVDRLGDFGLDLGVYGAPETYLVDGSGKILFRHAGPLNPVVWSREFLPRLKSNNRNNNGRDQE